VLGPGVVHATNTRAKDKQRAKTKTTARRPYNTARGTASQVFSSSSFIENTIESELYAAQIQEFRQDIVAYAAGLLGKRYRAGGKQPSTGFDCSGFTGYVFWQFGIKLANCSRAQSQMGVRIPIADAAPADLVFFGRKRKGRNTQIYHAGLVATNKEGRLQIIHSATGQGVIHTDLHKPGYWRNHLVCVRRVIYHPVALVAAE